MIDGLVFQHGSRKNGVKKIRKNIFYGMRVLNMKIHGEER
jgi:hypothetical protein